MHVSRQNGGILFVRGQQRTLRQQAVFVSVSEQKLTERQQIGVVPVGLGARRAGTSQSKLGCEPPSTNPNGSTSSMSEMERTWITARPLSSALPLVHGQRLTRGLHSWQEHDQQDMGLVVSVTPRPILRCVGAGIAEAQRAVAVAIAWPCLTQTPSEKPSTPLMPRARRPAAVSATWIASLAPLAGSVLIIQIAEAGWLDAAKPLPRGACAWATLSNM